MQRNKLLTLLSQSRQSAKLFLQSSELGLPPSPIPATGECAPPPFGPGGGGWEGTLACGRGVGGSLFRALCTVYKYFVTVVLPDASGSHCSLLLQ